MNRGLLSKDPHKSPGPMEYSPDSIKLKKTEAKFKMPKASRDIPFSKYGAAHSELVSKGLFWRSNTSTYPENIKESPSYKTKKMKVI